MGIFSIDLLHCFPSLLFPVFVVIVRQQIIILMPEGHTLNFSTCCSHTLWYDSPLVIMLDILTDGATVTTLSDEGLCKGWDLQSQFCYGGASLLSHLPRPHPSFL